MPVSTVERPVSALRQRMLEDMAVRGLRSDTQRDYVRIASRSHEDRSFIFSAVSGIWGNALCGG